MKRRIRRAGLVVAVVLGVLGSTSGAATEPQARRPNVLIVITDDQGYGDLAFHGNPAIRTPNLDRLARGSVRLTRFHVSPVCAPTRASLMTGRYNYRTGVVDTFIGRALMHPDEVTLAEMLAAAGYRTGIFGKWHLGDNAPMRPTDQGFQEALVLKGGGIGQPSDPPGGSSYFDPVLQHNGRAERHKGYVSDVLTDAAIAFIEAGVRPGPGDGPARPFFAYLAFNAPHAPLEVPEPYRRAYAEADLSNGRFPDTGYPLPGPTPKDVTARVYGMVTNIDDNLGRLFGRLDALGLTRDTLVIFLTDNGPQQVRYVGGMRGRKGSVYDGGIRVPCFVRWPGALAEGREVDRIAAHIDLALTVLDACGVARPEGVAFDGVSLWPLLTGRVAPDDWPPRTLFFQWHRGDVPQKFRAFAAREPRYKLVRAEGPTAPNPLTSELFDMEADPSERVDVAAEHPEVVERLKRAYSDWFDDVSRTRGFDPPRILLGSPRENPTTLTRQDWRGPRAGWEADSLGHWEVQVDRPGRYRLTLTLTPAPGPWVAHLACRGATMGTSVPTGATSCSFEHVQLTAGPGTLEAWLNQGGRTVGVWSVEVERLEGR
jgi:arylsulfatase A-like enzyme